MPSPTALLLAMLLSGPSPDLPVDTTLALGDRPAVVAFFGLLRVALEENQMLVQVFEDFRSSIGGARAGIEALPMDVHVVYDRTIDLSAGGQGWSLPVGAGLPVGYYFWAPGAPSYVCRGVRVDFDIVNEARNYLEAVRTDVYDTLLPLRARPLAGAGA